MAKQVNSGQPSVSEADEALNEPKNVDIIAYILTDECLTFAEKEKKLLKLQKHFSSSFSYRFGDTTARDIVTNWPKGDKQYSEISPEKKYVEDSSPDSPDTTKNAIIEKFEHIIRRDDVPFSRRKKLLLVYKDSYADLYNKYFPPSTFQRLLLVAREAKDSFMLKLRRTFR